MDILAKIDRNRLPKHVAIIMDGNGRWAGDRHMARLEGHRRGADVVRDIIDQRQYTDLATNPVFSTRDFRAVPQKYRTLVPEYVKDYVSLNQFAA